MARSVSYPLDAYVTYRALDEDADFIDREDLIYDWRNMARDTWPSMRDCDRWLDREDHAIAENRFAYFGVSEYCGMVAVWLAPKEPHWTDSAGWEAMRDHWIETAAIKLRERFGQYRHVATASNGEAFYEAI